MVSVMLAIGACSRTEPATSAGGPASAVAGTSVPAGDAGPTTPSAATKAGSTTVAPSTTTTAPTTTAPTTTPTSPGPTSTSTPPALLTKADYLVQANALCADMNRQVKALGNANTKDLLAYATYVESATGISRTTVASLRALAVPAGDEAPVAAMYTKVDAMIDTGTLLVSALRAGDRAQLQTLLEQLSSAATAAGDAAKDYGETECS
jgi:hypothetical protein